MSGQFSARLQVTATLLVLLLAGVLPLAAHDLSPGYLQVRQISRSTCEVLWRFSAYGEMRPPADVEFPSDCADVQRPTTRFVADRFVERRVLRRDAGWDGATIRVTGLDVTGVAVVTRIERLDHSTQTLVLTAASPSCVFAGSTAPSDFAWGFLQLGFEHILLGFDHLLFVLGLMLIVRSRWMLLRTITAFTVAHSITLAVATLGYASVPALPVEACIALSILFLGPEIVRQWRGETSFTIRHPWVVAFAFGLLHGFGFSSALSTAGLPRSAVPAALLCFNVGVEAGQLAFVAILLALERGLTALKIRWPLWLVRLPGWAVGVAGAFWTIQRTLLMLGWRPS